MRGKNTRKVLVSGKTGTYLVEKSLFQLDVIHDEGTLKYARNLREGESVKRVEIGSATLTRGSKFLPTLMLLRVFTDEKNFLDVVVRYPLNTAYHTAVVTARGEKTEDGVRYTEVFKEPIPAKDITTEKGFTKKVLREIFEEAQKDEFHPLHERVKGKQFSPEEVLEALRGLYRQNPREFKLAIREYEKAGRIAPIAGEEDIKIAQPVASKVVEAISKIRKGEPVEGVEAVPLNGIITGLQAVKGNLFVSVNFFPSRVDMVSTTYLGKVINNKYKDYRIVRGVLNHPLFRGFELSKLEDFVQGKLSEEEREKFKLTISNAVAGLQRKAEKATDPKVAEMLKRLVNDLNNLNVEGIKLNLNRLRDYHLEIFNRIMAEENVVPYEKMYIKVGDGYALRNTIANTGITPEFAKTLLEELAWRKKTDENTPESRNYLLMVPIPRVVKDKERGFVTKFDNKPIAFVKFDEDFEVEKVVKTPADYYARRFEEKIWRRLNFIKNRAKTEEQARTILGEGFEKYPGLAKLKEEFAKQKIAIGYVEFVDYLMDKLSKAENWERMKEVIDSDPVISDFMKRVEFYQKGRNVVDKLLNSEQGLKVFKQFAMKTEQAIEKNPDVQKELNAVEYNLIRALEGGVRYSVDFKKLASKRKEAEVEMSPEDIAKYLGGAGMEVVEEIEGVAKEEVQEPEPIEEGEVAVPEEWNDLLIGGNMDIQDQLDLEL